MYLSCVSVITREDLRRCAVGASESEVATSWVGGWDARNDTTEAGGDQQHSWEAALLRLEGSGTPVFRESVVEEDMARQGHPGRDRQDATRDGNIPEGLHRVIPVRQAAGQHPPCSRDGGTKRGKAREECHALTCAQQAAVLPWPKLRLSASMPPLVKVTPATPPWKMVRAGKSWLRRNTLNPNASRRDPGGQPTDGSAQDEKGEQENARRPPQHAEGVCLSP